jgi:hypothetical protein
MSKNRSATSLQDLAKKIFSILFYNCFFIIILYVFIESILTPILHTKNLYREFFKSEKKIHLTVTPILIKNVTLKPKSLERSECTNFPKNVNKTKSWCFNRDETGNRLTLPLTTDNTQSLITFGGSFIHGDLLNDNQTLASFLQKKLFKYKVYNYGISAGSVHQFLEKVLNNSLNPILKNKDVTVIYGGIEDHIRRSNYGSGNCCFSWGERFITINSKLYHQKNYNDILPKEIPYYLLAMSTTFNMITSGSNFHSAKTNQEQFNNYCMQLREIKNQISLRTTGKVRFLGLSYQNMKSAKQCYRDLKIEYVDISDIKNKYDHDDLFIKNNGHPTELLNDLISKRFYKIL